jgi:hypothetical protein
MRLLDFLLQVAVMDIQHIGRRMPRTNPTEAEAPTFRAKN